MTGMQGPLDDRPPERPCRRALRDISALGPLPSAWGLAGLIVLLVG